MTCSPRWELLTRQVLGCHAGPPGLPDAYSNVTWGGWVLCANGREAIKIELLKCKGCLIQWFIQMRYQRKRDRANMWLKIPLGWMDGSHILYLFIFLLMLCRLRDSIHDIATRRSPESNSALLHFGKRMILTKGSHYFQLSGLVHNSWAAPRLSFLNKVQFTDISADVIDSNMAAPVQQLCS